jgi:phenylalanyl-tRNA synthetase beta chain
VEQSVTIGAILNQFEKIAQKQSLIEQVFLFDVFEGENLSENKKSLSFRVVYRAANRTLKEKNIKKLHTNISKTIIDLFNAALPE